MCRPSELVARPTSQNPFSEITDFLPLDKELNTEGKNLPEVINTVADHMVKNKIGAAVVTCLGVMGKSKKHFVNLGVMREQSPESFGTVSGVHHGVHMESPKHNDVVVLKASTVKKVNL